MVKSKYFVELAFHKNGKKTYLYKGKKGELINFSVCPYCDNKGWYINEYGYSTKQDAERVAYVERKTYESVDYVTVGVKKCELTVADGVSV